ncbi:MAG: outer membrane lipoprotein-sorting protein [Candidatus Aminicenantes bacterium]|nr:outer membrane lipoprotein-sorting protein [Candidatus Aminicenantes bacterium]
MKKAVLGIILLCVAAAGLAQAQAPSAETILDRVDRNAVPGTKIIVAEMTIHGRRDSRTIKSKSWIQGEEKAFTEYLDPPRERGIKMLKLGDQLWTYSPDTDRTIAISGHMLRQSVMGSDLSYEDMLEDRKLRQAYESRVAGEEVLGDRPCWILELTAKAGDAAYASRKAWIDKERYVALKEERYAKSGKLLKTLEVKSVVRKGDRWIQDRIVFRDVLKSGSGTEMAILSIEMDAPIPETVFSKASLRK